MECTDAKPVKWVNVRNVATAGGTFQVWRMSLTTVGIERLSRDLVDAEGVLPSTSMKIAVTGCNGRVGQRVVLLALQRGHAVLGLDNSENASPVLSDNASYEFLRLDLRDYEDTLKAIDGCDAIVHLAGLLCNKSKSSLLTNQ